MTSLGERLQALRKSRGLSQEQLAEQAGVSRQAVSKWELGESTPELDKVILLSDFFGVTTDYLIKGGGPAQAPEDKRSAIGQVQFICSAGFLAIGLLAAFCWWNGDRPDSAIWAGMIIQVAGVVWYFAGKLICKQEPPFFIKLLDWALGLFMPVSMASCYIVYRQFCPYPPTLLAAVPFWVIYLLALFVVYRHLKRPLPPRG